MCGIKFHFARAPRAISKTARATSFVMDEEKLVEAVRGCPCLWKLTETGYKDGKSKENAWVAVAVEVRKYA